MSHTTKVTEAVSTAFDIPISEINGRSLKHRTCLARAMVYLVLRDRYAYTGGEISRMFKRDTACVCRALQQMDHMLTYDKGLIALQKDVIRLIDWN